MTKVVTLHNGTTIDVWLHGTILFQDTPIVFIARRWLNLQEYASKQLLKDHGLTVQKFVVVESAEDAAKQLKTFSIAKTTKNFCLYL